MLQEILDHKIPAASQRNSKYDSKMQQMKSKSLTMLNHTDTDRKLLSNFLLLDLSSIPQLHEQHWYAPLF
jgi:hypothetical protein